MDEQAINTEVVGVLMTLGDTYISKLPFEVWQYLMNHSNKSQIRMYDRDKGIQEQDISKDARVLLTVLKLQYFCDTPEEKEALISVLRKNENKKE